MAARLSPGRTVYSVPIGASVGDALGGGSSVAGVGNAGSEVGVGVTSGVAHPASRSAPARSSAAGRPRGGIGLVRVVAEIAGGNRRHGTVGQEPRFAAQQVELGAQTAGRVRELQQLL